MASLPYNTFLILIFRRTKETGNRRVIIWKTCGVLLMQSAVISSEINRDEVMVTAESPFSEDAVALMEELSDRLESITGDSGRSSFRPEDVCGDRAVFAVARNGRGEPLGCGGIRPMDSSAAEVKRVYAKEQASGIGTKILGFLEQIALSMGYESLRLATRRVNTRAVAFYERRGYRETENYGIYCGRPDAVCFEKRLPVERADAAAHRNEVEWVEDSSRCRLNA